MDKKEALKRLETIEKEAAELKKIVKRWIDNDADVLRRKQ